ncbi:unnamed protein product [Polarella glacialis]|uniref:Uncharacterized protein n=1 Tax=Polarella glacialis TaxID=89957 RepID=A0A813DUV2_POLGL|nr:unnamed protein product [Polarella glacialis]
MTELSKNTNKQPTHQTTNQTTKCAAGASQQHPDHILKLQHHSQHEVHRRRLLETATVPTIGRGEINGRQPLQRRPTVRRTPTRIAAALAGIMARLTPFLAAPDSGAADRD